MSLRSIFTNSLIYDMTSNQRQRCIALFDANNFFVSCERVFRPDLVNRGVIVLSSNDGNAISRSNEAKAFGIKMGEPLFKIKELVREHNIEVFSSNFPLYADMSNRLMSIISQFTPIQEIYSVDESFADLTGCLDIEDRCRRLKQTILRDTTLGVGVGTGSTKVLAKLANFISKRHPKSKGIFHFHLLTSSQMDSVLRNIPTHEVWGIGKQLSGALAEFGIHTAKELRDSDIATMRKRFGLVMEKQVRELRGESCIEIEEATPKKKQIINSRSFGDSVTRIEDLQSALAHFVTNATRKLREQHCLAGMMQVFLMTNQYRQDQPQYCPSVTIPFDVPSANLMTLQNWAMTGLASIYREGYFFKKAGVMLSQLCDENAYQGDLFSSVQENSSVMEVVDSMNLRYGKGTLKLSQDSNNEAWKVRQERKSPGYTTNWDEIPMCN